MRSLLKRRLSMSKVNPLRDKYLAHAKKQKLSGLSIRAYCEENNLVEHKLSYYRSYKLNSKPKKIKEPAFAKVEITDKKIVKQTNIDPIWLAQLINQLNISR